MNNEEKILKIKEDNSTLLKNVKEELNSNSDSFKTSIDTLSGEVKLNKISEVKELINTLTIEIDNASDIETIMELRKKLNYFINKIKKELEKREIVSNTVEEFKNKTVDYRKSIAKEIRYLKRIKNIEEIERLNASADILSEEGLLNLKKMIRREQNYNNKNLKPSKPVKKENTLKIKNIKVNKTNTTKLIEQNSKSINESLSEISTFYKLNKLPEYDKGVGANVFTLVKNIPSYLRNKKILSSIDTENEVFDKKVLKGFVEFNKKRNSIRLTLREIISPKYKSSIESLYLKSDYYCSYWIKNCYNMSYSKSLTK